MAIREMMRADVTALNQGVRNANDAISLIQTADGALGVIDEKLTRMKELAEQAATGTYTSTQRLIIDSEYQAMASEITRIANATDFNGMKLLDGSLSGATHDGSKADAEGMMKIHFGTGNDSAEDYYYIRIQEATAAALGVGSSSNFETSIDRAMTLFANAIKNEFGSMATGTAEEREAYQNMIDVAEGVIRKSVETANKVFDSSKSVEEQYEAYSSLFKRPEAGAGEAVNQQAGEGMRVYGSVEELQKAAFEYYRAETANGVGSVSNGFDTAVNHEKALNNIAKMFDNAIIVGKNGNMLPELSKEDFMALSDTDREALKTDFSMAMLNTAVNGTNAQQSNTSTSVTGADYINYDKMAGQGSGAAGTRTAYDKDQINNFISHLNYGYEAGKVKTEAINSIKDDAVGKYGEGSYAVKEFESGTMLRVEGILQDDVILKANSSPVAGDPYAVTAGSKLAAGSTLVANSTLGAGTMLGEGTVFTATQTLVGANAMNLGKGTVFGTGTTLVGATALGAGTTLTNGTTLTAGVLGQGTVLGDGTTLGATTQLQAGTTLGAGTNLGKGSTLDKGTVIGAGTNLAGETLGEGTVLGKGSQVAGSLSIEAGAKISVKFKGTEYTITNGTAGADTLANLSAGAGITAGDIVELTQDHTLGATAGGAPMAAGTIAGGTTILGAKLTVAGAAGLTLQGTTTVQGAATNNVLAGVSTFKGTTLGAVTTLAGNSTIATGTTLQGTSTALVGTLGAGSTLGANLISTVNMVLGAGTKMGAGTTVGGAAITVTGNIELGGTTTLNGASTLVAGSKLSAETELAAGSLVPEGTKATNGKLFTGTAGDDELNGVYGALGYNEETGTIERDGHANFGSLQASVEKMLQTTGTDAANTISMNGNNVKTQENAQKALKAIDNAILIKDNIRADLGALQNRLENTITNLTTQAENLQAAESRISDVDVATEMTEFTRNQVLTQSAVSMLAQANTMPQMALKLIG